MSAEKAPLSMHAARMALNNNPQIRAWAEEWVKEQERQVFMAGAEAKTEDFERHWRYVRPEKMHENAIAAVEAYYSKSDK